LDKLTFKEGLQNYALDIGENYNTLRNYRTVAEAYPIDARASKLSHRHHHVIAAREDRQEGLAKAASASRAYTVSRR
jgi:hypothetical protein